VALPSDPFALVTSIEDTFVGFVSKLPRSLKIIPRYSLPRLSLTHLGLGGNSFNHIGIPLFFFAFASKNQISFSLRVESESVGFGGNEEE
jgi:hypothetical protein